MTAVPATTSTSQATARGATAPRAARRAAPWARVLRAAQRRRHLTEQRRHEQEPTTDAYIDRFGEPGIDARSFAAFLGR